MLVDNLPLGGAELDNYGYITKEKEDDNKRIFFCIAKLCN